MDVRSTKDGTAVTVAYAWPVDLTSANGTVLAQARWLTVQWGRAGGPPNRLYYGSEIGKVDGGFEITGDIHDLEQATWLAYDLPPGGP